MKYTIKQLSELAHVAQSTVSKALNGQKGVSEKKRREILRLAQETNYSPNASARALAHQKTETIGLVIPPSVTFSTTGLYWSELIASIVEEANKKGYNLLLVSSGTAGAHQVIASTLQRRSLDGLVIPAELLSVQIISLLDEHGVPFVLQGKSVICDRCTVDVRSQTGAARIAGRLIDRGFRHVGCIAGPDSFLYTTERVEGFRQTMAAHGRGEPPVVYTRYDRESAKEATRRLVRENPGMDALFATAGGEFIFYILEALKEEQVDLSRFFIAMFDDYLPLRYLPYNIIAAHQPIGEMGTQDAKNLLQLIAGEPTPSLSLFDVTLTEYGRETASA